MTDRKTKIDRCKVACFTNIVLLRPAVIELADKDILTPASCTSFLFTIFTCETTGHARRSLHLQPNVGAFLVRIGFWVHYHIVLIRNRPYTTPKPLSQPPSARGNATWPQTAPHWPLSKPELEVVGCAALIGVALIIRLGFPFKGSLKGSIGDLW